MDFLIKLWQFFKINFPHQHCKLQTFKTYLTGPWKRQKTMLLVQYFNFQVKSKILIKFVFNWSTIITKTNKKNILKKSSNEENRVQCFLPHPNFRTSGRSGSHHVCAEYQLAVRSQNGTKRTTYLFFSIILYTFELFLSYIDLKLYIVQFLTIVVFQMNLSLFVKLMFSDMFWTNYIKHNAREFWVFKQKQNKNVKNKREKKKFYLWNLKSFSQSKSYLKSIKTSKDSKLNLCASTLLSISLHLLPFIDLQFIHLSSYSLSTHDSKFKHHSENNHYV